MKRVLSVVVGTGLVVGALSGCSFGEKVTAESLLGNPYQTDKVESIDMNLSFDITMGMDLGALTGGNDGGTASMGMSADLDVISDESVGHVLGTVTVEMLGMSQEMKVESYSDIAEGIVYSYDESTDSWTKSEESVSGIESLSMEGIAGIIDDAVLEEYKKGDEVYAVTGKVDFGKISEVLGSEVADVTESISDVADFDDAVANIRLEFDKDTKVLKSILLSVDVDSIPASEGITFDKFETGITINSVNYSKVSIPKDVLVEAVEEGLVSEWDTDGYTYSDEVSVLPDESEDRAVVTEDEVVQDDVLICEYLFGVEYASLDDAESILSQVYSKLPDDNVVIAFNVLLSGYTVSEFDEKLDSWATDWDDYDKTALAFLYDMGSFEEGYLESKGISLDEIKVLVKEYVTPCL